MADPVATRWQAAFMQAVQRRENADRLREAATNGRLRSWTTAMTECVVAACESMGWIASAIGHKARLLPVDQSEYLAVDVMAFGNGAKRWRFPVAVMQLENSQNDDRVAYSTWKVLCVCADLRVVFCYRRRPDNGPALVRFLERDVIQAMALAGRVGLEGETVLVIGSTNEAEYFPYGFFRWWQLDAGTGKFELKA